MSRECIECCETKNLTKVDGELLCPIHVAAREDAACVEEDTRDAEEAANTVVVTVGRVSPKGIRLSDERYAAWCSWLEDKFAPYIGDECFVTIVQSTKDQPHFAGEAGICLDALVSFDIAWEDFIDG